MRLDFLTEGMSRNTEKIQIAHSSVNGEVKQSGNKLFWEGATVHTHSEVEELAQHSSREHLALENAALELVM